MNEEDDGKGSKDEKDQHNDPAIQNDEKTQGDEKSEGLDAADSEYSVCIGSSQLITQQQCPMFRR